MVREEWQWLNVPVEAAARRLLGSELVREIEGQRLVARIVEVEAYDQADPASHTYLGRTARNDAMFKSAGHAYVYLIHGIHNCVNIVTGVEGYGSGVLIRAVEPLEGEGLMAERRGRTGVEITNGPGKVCAALAITRQLSGHNLASPPLQLLRRPELPGDQIVIGPRIGISKALHELRRFYIKGNPYVSKAKK
jgi:DNA-3-methyladenine glycosylase